MYNVSGMTDKNKDSLIKDLLDLVASSGNPFFNTLFPDRVDPNSKKRPPTAGDRIKVCHFSFFFFLVVFVCNRLSSNLLVHWSTI